MEDKPGDWRVFSANPDSGSYTLIEIEQEGEDKAFLVTYKVQLDTSPLFDMNHEDLVDSNGKRFGDGKVIARVPEHLLYSNEAGNLGRAFAEDDKAHVRRVLNDPDYAKFRSFRGRL